jgi:hypothetical protein
MERLYTAGKVITVKTGPNSKRTKHTEKGLPQSPADDF